MHIYASVCTHLLVHFKFPLPSFRARSINLVSLIKAFKAQSYENILSISTLGMSLAVGSIYLPCHLVSCWSLRGPQHLVFLKFSIKDRQIMSFPTTLSKAWVYQGCLAGTIKPCRCLSWGGHCYCSICPLPDKSHYSCGHTPLAGPGELGCDGEEPLAPGRAHPGQDSSETFSGWGASGKRVSRSSFGCSLGFASLLVLQRCVSEGIFQGLLSLTKHLKLQCFAKISLFLFLVDFFLFLLPDWFSFRIFVFSRGTAREDSRCNGLAEVLRSVQQNPAGACHLMCASGANTALTLLIALSGAILDGSSHLETLTWGGQASIRRSIIKALSQGESLPLFSPDPKHPAAKPRKRPVCNSHQSFI